MDTYQIQTTNIGERGGEEEEMGKSEKKTGRWQKIVGYRIHEVDLLSCVFKHTCVSVVWMDLL